MSTLVGNLIYLGILFFAACLVIYGLLKFVKVLKGDETAGQAIASVAVVIVGAALVVWAAMDFNGNHILINTIGTWIQQILTEPLGG